MTEPALIELKDIGRQYPSGEEQVTVLKNVNLSIHSGEMIAIVGASGSGKSTLMNILGCLDRPSSGTYMIAGRATSQLSPDDLAELRREHFGFIFQRYHLLSDLTAQDNVEVPAVYNGMPRSQRQHRAAEILSRLGLSHRLRYKPGQLSGGQQQRVSIARALMNGGRIILADEPTGALDSQSGQEVLRILKELNAEGHTVILVTHDRDVAAHARRVIEISDGIIISDRLTAPMPPSGLITPPITKNAWAGALERFYEAGRMAVLAMNAHRLRTFLTMLGIIIGIASVVSVVALGEGSRQRILSDISAMGTNTIDIYPGTGFGDQRSGRVRTLVPADAEAIALQPYVDSTTPSVSASANLRYGNKDLASTVNGVGDQYFRVRGFTLAAGKSFNTIDVSQLVQDVVIDNNTRKQLFPRGENALGAVILLNNMPARIIGVLDVQKSMFGNSEALNIYAPYTTVMHRMTGQNYLRSITVRMTDAVSTATAQEALTRLLQQRHGGIIDFYVMNTDSIRQTIESTTQTMTLLISAIAVISLVVGGIGVMNIMLVSVTERTREIGVRMAVGARQWDVMSQFLIEAVLVCLLGGILGVLLSLALGRVVMLTGSSFQMVYSTTSMVLAFTCSTLIGIIFGFLPARSAARLNPVEALSRE